VKLLLDSGADPNVHDGVDNDNNTPLHEAAHQGHTEVGRLLLNRGADPSLQDNYGDTPIQCAAFAGDTDVMQLLLDGRADPTIKNRSRRTTLESVKERHPEVVQLLICREADPNIKDGRGRTAVGATKVGDGNEEQCKRPSKKREIN
jgi:ankyrin repeat protein